ncbi:MAG: type II toxin-antitoxin system HipA family toxin [Kiritimatiellae bacterium]|nr:type II toxin-antitoxin system HipA family toxin [Kiritimatiellia bacterium]
MDVFLWERHVGRIAPDFGSYFQFQYDPDFVRGGYQIAPIEMPLREEIYKTIDFELPHKTFRGLPGVFADSLPDSFGNRLVDEWLEGQGIPKKTISPLDRLVYVGSRGMGALTYEPAAGPARESPTAIDMRRLVEEARLALNADLSKMDGPDALREIIRVGTSAGGAQAKAVVGWNRSGDSFLTGDGELPAGYEHWLVKFTPEALPDAGREEYETYLKAREAGIAMSECRLLELDGEAHFMTRRFDRDGPVRHHLQTLCALQHLPQGGPRNLYSYDVLFDTADALGLGYETLEEIFRRMAFNVYNREMDDHTKNFSFMMRRSGAWELAPAYDLTGIHFSAADGAFDEWQNLHALSVNGKFSSIGDDDILAVGERYGIGTAPRVLAKVKSVFGR